MFIVLIFLSLCGLGALVIMGNCALRPQWRTSRVWRMGTIFGVAGLAIPVVCHLVGVDTASSADLVWPTQITIWPNRPDDSVWKTPVFLSMGILSNIGLYAIVGLTVGVVWTWIGRRNVTTVGDNE